MTWPCMSIVCALAAQPFPGHDGDFPPFTRGDVDRNQQIEVTDAVVILNHLFLSGGPLPCPDAADVNDDAKINLTDPIGLLNFLFLDGASLEPPVRRGRDRTRDTLPCEAGPVPCPEVAEITVLGTLARGIEQPAGIVRGQRNPAILWTLNDFDSGQDPTVYATHDSEIVARLQLCLSEDRCPPMPPSEGLCDSDSRDLIHCDWEAITLGPGEAGRPTVFVGDLGGNRTVFRTLFTIHRIVEPTLDEEFGGVAMLYREVGDFDTLFFRYPGDGRFDSEALLSDPVTGGLFVITQAPARALYRYPGPQRAGVTVTLEHVMDMPPLPQSFLGDIVSGAEISPSGDAIALKVHSRISILDWDATSSTPIQAETCRLELADYLGWKEFHAGAVAYDSDGSLLSTEENPGEPIYRIRF